MNETSRENQEIERLLRRAKLPEPSAELKERVITAARQAWGQTTPDIPWQIPIRRLVVSAAAAVLMVSLANYCGDHACAGWQSNGSTAAAEEPADSGDWPEMSYSPLVRHLTTINRPVRSPATLLEYMEKLREILGESDPGEAPDAGAPVEYKSHLLPMQLNFYS